MIAEGIIKSFPGILVGLGPLIAVALLLIAFRLYWPSIAGWLGEMRVRSTLMGLPTGTYTVLHDVLLSCEDGKTTQIDHIVCGPACCFVIETKAHAGWIYGKASDRKWTQVFNRRAKFPFQNPIMQNMRHVNAVRRVIGNTPVQNVVIFVRGQFPKGKPDGVFTPGELNTFIRSFEKGTTHCDAGKMQSALQDAMLTAPQAKKEHVSRLQKQYGGRWRVPAGHVCAILAVVAVLFALSHKQRSNPIPASVTPQHRATVPPPLTTPTPERALQRPATIKKPTTPIQVIAMSKGRAAVMEDGQIITLNVGQQTPRGWQLTDASTFHANLISPDETPFQFGKKPQNNRPQ